MRSSYLPNVRLCTHLDTQYIDKLDNSDSYVVTINIWLHSKYLMYWQCCRFAPKYLALASELTPRLSVIYSSLCVQDQQLRGSSLLTAPESCHLQTGDRDQEYPDRDTQTRGTHTRATQTKDTQTRGILTGDINPQLGAPRPRVLRPRAPKPG